MDRHCFPRRDTVADEDEARIGDTMRCGRGRKKGRDHHRR
jgi:hypothetical protein